MKELKLAMVFHCFQPVFNFDGEIEEAYTKSYLPFLKVVEKFPAIKATFHYSGNMLEWFQKRHPEYLDLIRKLLDRKQIELMGGGLFEPVMVLIPEIDRKEQLLLNSRMIQDMFGARPRGAWLAERVWEPEIAETFFKAGIEYTVIDDNHILRAGLSKKDVFSPYRTGGDKNPVTLFPSLRELRYYIPFRKASHVLRLIEAFAKEADTEDKCFFFADDMEKFGAWPHTYNWVYKKGWLEKFFSLIEKNSPRLRTATYSEILDTVQPKHMPLLPASSYAEMMDWSGGDFRNFLKKYPEVDRMHKRMMSISSLVHQAEEEHGKNGPADRDIIDAKNELFKAQTSCAYWHGTFGGVYLPHLRDGVYKHLLAAQKIIDKASGDEAPSVKSVECRSGDAVSETLLGNEHFGIFVRPHSGGVIAEIDYKPRNVNLTNTFSRVREGYHKKLGHKGLSTAWKVRKDIARTGIPDVHEILGVAEKGLKNFLFYDNYARGSFQTHIFRNGTDWEKLGRGTMGLGEFLIGGYAAYIDTARDSIICRMRKRSKVKIGVGGLRDIEVLKEVDLGAKGEITLTNEIIEHTPGDDGFNFAMEFNFLVWDQHFMGKQISKRSAELLLKDMYSGMEIGLSFDRPLKVLTCPVYTVNETEEGLRKTFQGISVFVGDSISAFRKERSGSVGMNITVR